MAFFSQKRDKASQASPKNDYVLPEVVNKIQNGVVERIDPEQLYQLLSDESLVLQQVGFKQLLKQSSPDSVSDLELLGLMMSNHPRFSQLGCTWWFQRDYNEVKRCIRHRCDGPEHNEEVASEALYRASRNIIKGLYKSGKEPHEDQEEPDEDQDKPLIAYPIGISRNITASYWRVKYKYKYNMVPLDDCQHLLRSRSDLVEAQVNSRHELSEVERFLSLLDEQKRAIFELYVLDGMSAKEVGNQFGKTDSNVRKIVSRIKKNLKQHLRGL